MNLHTAKQPLHQDLDDPGSVPIEQLNEAQQLGIEALGHCIQEQAIFRNLSGLRLPGETKE